MGSFLKWVAGIAGPVLVGVLIWYITVPHSTVIQGMVYSTQQEAIPNAMVSIRINGVTGGPYHDVTDEKGSYLFEFDNLSRNWEGEVSATVIGFNSSGQIQLQHSKQVRQDIQLSPARSGMIPKNTLPGLHPQSHFVPPLVPLKFIPKPLSMARKIDIKKLQ